MKYEKTVVAQIFDNTNYSLPLLVLLTPHLPLGVAVFGCVVLVLAHVWKTSKDLTHTPQTHE